MIKSFLLLLFLSPLLYSFDNDALREEKVLIVAALAGLFLSVYATRKQVLVSNIKQIVIILLFSSLVIAQQFFIENGSFAFGLKYAVVFLASFIPYWIASTVRLGEPALKRTLSIAITLLFAVTAATISTSYAFGIGEVHIGDGRTARAFGWLGDSFTPVIVFFVTYYFLLKRYLFAALSLLLLLMTGGKAAALMLIAIPGILAFSNASAKTKFAVALLGIASVVLLVLFADPILENGKDFLLLEHSLNTRLLSIYNGLNYFANAPWIGVGINQSMRFVEGDSAGLATSLGIDAYYEVYQIHNAVIRTAAETGALGLTLFVLFLIVLVRDAYRVLLRGKHLSDRTERAIVLTSSLWVISFVFVYQTTGWFEAGHPQLSWLLLISSLSTVLLRGRITEGSVVNGDLRASADESARLRSA